MTTSATKAIPTIVGAGVTMGVADTMLGRRTKAKKAKTRKKKGKAKKKRKC